jgi:hypothetical protein
VTDESNLEEKAFIPISKVCTSRLSKFEISDKLERASVRLSRCFDDISTYHSIANVANKSAPPSPPPSPPPTRSPQPLHHDDAVRVFLDSDDIISTGSVSSKSGYPTSVLDRDASRVFKFETMAPRRLFQASLGHFFWQSSSFSGYRDQFNFVSRIFLTRMSRF